MQSRPDSHPPKRRQVSPGRLPGRSRHHGAPEGDAGAGGGKRTPFAGGRGRGRGRRGTAAGSGRGGSRRFSEPLGTLPRSAPPAVPSYGLRKRKACDYGESDDPSEEEEEEVEVQRPVRDDHRRDTVRGGARTLMTAAAPSSRGRSEGRARDEGGAKATLPSRSLRSNSLPGGSHPGVKVEEGEEDGSGGEGEEEEGSPSGGEGEEEESEEEVGCVCGGMAEQMTAASHHPCHAPLPSLPPYVCLISYHITVHTAYPSASFLLLNPPPRPLHCLPPPSRWQRQQAWNSQRLRPRTLPPPPKKPSTSGKATKK